MGFNKYEIGKLFFQEAKIFKSIPHCAVCRMQNGKVSDTYENGILQSDNSENTYREAIFPT